MVEILNFEPLMKSTSGKLDIAELDELLRRTPSSGRLRPLLSERYKYDQYFVEESAKQTSEEWPGFDLLEAEDRHAAEQAILKAWMDSIKAAESHPLVKYLGKDMGFQLARKRIGFRDNGYRILQSDVSNEFQRRLTLSNCRDKNGEEMTSFRYVRSIPPGVYGRHFNYINWAYAVEKVIRSYLSGTTVDFSVAISEQVDKARKGLSDYIEAAESSSAEYYGDLISPSEDAIRRYPLQLHSDRFEWALRQKLAQLEELQKDIDSLRVIRRRTDKSEERMFFVNLAICNIRTIERVEKRAVMAFVESEFLTSVVDEKTAQRACDDAEEMVETLQAIRRRIESVPFRNDRKT